MPCRRAAGTQGEFEDVEIAVVNLKMTQQGRGFEALADALQLGNFWVSYVRFMMGELWVNGGLMIIS